MVRCMLFLSNPLWHASNARPALTMLAQIGLVMTVLATGLRAQDDSKTGESPASRYVKLSSPITDESLGIVRRAALELQNLASTEGRDAYLILELTPGISQFHHTYAVADFLATEPLTNVTTIAWISESVTGNNVFVALSCNEIVMHPDAELGDMGRGAALANDQQMIVQSIVNKRRNPKVNGALAEALMAPAVQLLQLTIDVGNGEKETRLATEAETKRLRAEGVVILSSKTIKESGTPGLFSGAQVRAEDILAVRTSMDRRELIDSYGLPLEALRESGRPETIGQVAYIELKDEIDDVFASFAQRQIGRAIQSGAELIVFEIDSPGGGLFLSRDLAFEIANLSDRGIRTVAYVPDKAFSGGTIVALGCDEIYMKPEATIGDAIPIQFFESGFIHADEKTLSVEVEALRQLGRLKNRPEAILEAFADESLEVFQVTHKDTGRVWYMSDDEIHKEGDDWIRGPRVTESRPGTAITIGGARAHELKVAEAPVAGIEELKDRLGIPPDLEFRKVERTWVDTLVFVLNTNVVTGLLFFVAIICIYIELSTMTGVFGIISAVAFSLFFWSRVLGGTATGLEIVLFVVGLLLLGMEIFVVPGFGVFGVTGILLLLGSLIMAGQTFTGIGLDYDLKRAGETVLTFGGAMVAVVIASMILSHFLPRIPILREIILTPPGGQQQDEPRLRPELETASAALVGASGTTVTVLRPAGKARIDGRLMDVVSDGPYVETGMDVTVVDVQGNRIVVREC